jgi:murein DD-endopeptidase MepM/ murein hydrolase activator NlpD
VVAFLLVPLAVGLSCSGPTGPAIPDHVDCSRFPSPARSPYVLPFEVGQAFRVSRTFDHYLTANGGVGLYAIDFVMPIGTPVHAARAGVVVAVEDRYSDDDHADFHENWAMVRHADSTVARLSISRRTARGYG